jgi:hypothetical protein
MNTLVSRIFLFITGLFFSTTLFAQYPPPAGHPGTTAMYKDSIAFVGWASTCIIERGYINLSDTTILFNGSNKTTYGSFLFGSGPADELVVSLGDHGSALLGFNSPIVNRAGPDFAVFENSFGGTFLELGFVEVSSDGQRFVRFPAISLTPDNLQVNTFDTIDATKINNFAGKYQITYGTPFDLEDIKDSSGIDINHIIYVKIIDAGGCIQTPYSTYDSKGHKVNDPWPTPFDTGGFDLDAVGVIHDSTKVIIDDDSTSVIQIYPNPVVETMTIASAVLKQVGIKLTDLSGRILLDDKLILKATLDLSSFPAGIYIARFSLQDGTSISKKVVKY